MWGKGDYSDIAGLSLIGKALADGHTVLSKCSISSRSSYPKAANDVAYSPRFQACNQLHAPNRGTARRITREMRGLSSLKGHASGIVGVRSTQQVHCNQIFLLEGVGREEQGREGGREGRGLVLLGK